MSDKIPFKKYPIEQYLPQERLELPVRYDDREVAIIVTILDIDVTKDVPENFNELVSYNVIFKELSEALEIPEETEFEYAGIADDY